MKLFATIFTCIVIFQSLEVSTKLSSVEKMKITVTVPNISSDKGTINYALYNKETFMLKPLQSKTTFIENKKSSVVFEDVEPGEYAIICFHDVNGNKAMDFDERGMPIEDYGVSNNTESFGPPQYMDAKFIVADKNVTLEIKF